MELISVTVQKFKNILSSGNVAIRPDVTCLVGKNESGKTAFLQALYRLNPAYDERFDAQRHYPAWLEKQHRRQYNLDEFTPVTAVFQLSEDEVSALESDFGQGAISSSTITASRSYGNQLSIECDYAEAKVISHILRNTKWLKGQKPTNLQQIYEIIDKHNAQEGADEDTSLAKKRAAELTQACDAVLGGHDNIADSLQERIIALLPVFFYFDEYSQLSGSVKIKELLSKKQAQLTRQESTARALLELAAAEKEYLLNPDYETRKRELENVANAITHDVLTYWSTNPELRTEIDITLKQETTPQGQQQVLDELKVRLYDNRHLLSLPFEERSSGFRWFFSFLAAFSRYEHSKGSVIILLDEPGIGLHARAQADFLRFIDERLSKRRQVIYTTHSPFMVQPGKLERVRMVEDGGREVGSRVTDNVLSSDKDTIFPLQGALGYDLAQHLFISPNNLVVEGTSDFTYLYLLSEHLKEGGREGLDEKWSIVPVGGVDLVPSFVALLGRHLDVTVLVDSRKEGHQRLQQLTQQGILKDTRIITVGQIVGQKAADIEDLFEPQEYLKLFNKAFGKNISTNDLSGTDPIVRKCARLLGVDRYDHGKPATILLKTQVDFLPSLSDKTLGRFEALFKKINETL